MPIYEYVCGKCQHRFEKKQGYDEKPEAECPQCEQKAYRVFHPSPIIFKGSGFYITDSRNSSTGMVSGTKETGQKGKQTEKPAEKQAGN